MTGPGKRDDPAARERAEQRRNEQIRQTGNPMGNIPPLRDSDGGPMRVRLDGISEEAAETLGKRRGENGQLLDPSKAVGGTPIGDERAVSQTLKQLTADLRKALDMQEQFQSRARTEGVEEKQRDTEREQRRGDHLRDVLDAISGSLRRQEEREEKRDRRERMPGDDSRTPRHPAEDEHRPARPDFDDDFDDHVQRPAPPTHVDLDEAAGVPPPGPRRPDDTQPIPPVQHPAPPSPPTPPPGGGSGGGGGGGGGGRGGGGGGGGGGRPPRPPGGSGSPDNPTPDDGPEFGPGNDDGRTEWERENARRQRTQGERDREATDLRSRPLPFALQHRTRHQMRRAMRERVAEEMHQRFGEGIEQNQTLLPQYDDEGNLSHHVLRQEGREDERVEHGDSRLPGLLRGAARQRMVSTVASGFRLAGMAGVAKAIPVVGQAIAVADAANTAMEWVTDQNKQNSQYQSIYASDSKWGVEGVGQRIGEEAYVLGNRFNALSGGLNEQDARAAFRGTSELGYRGAQRTENLDFIERQYANLGVDVQTSLKLVSMSAQGANTHLAGLDKALGSVGKMARLTGQNANVLYDSFAKNYALALQSSSGAGAATEAAVLTQLGSGASRDFQNVNYSPLYSEPSKRIIANNAGKSYSWLEAQKAQGNWRPWAEAVDRRNTQIYGSAMSGQGNVRQTIQDEIARRGGKDKVSQQPGLYREIALKAMEAQGADPENLKRFLTANNVEDASQLTDQQVFERLVQYETGDMSFVKSYEQNEQKFKTTDVDTSGQDWWTGQKGSDFVRSHSTVSPWGKLGFGESGQRQEAIDAYATRQAGGTGEGKGKGKSDPVIEQLIEKFGGDSSIGVKVQTGKGEKVVSLADAISYYPDQVTKGTASIVGGDPSSDGQSIKDVLGGASSNSQDVDTTKSEDDRGGVSEEEWREDNPTTASEERDSAGGGKIELSMSDELKKWFTANVSGNVTDPATESGASNSVPPAPGGGIPQ